MNSKRLCACLRLREHIRRRRIDVIRFFKFNKYNTFPKRMNKQYHTQGRAGVLKISMAVIISGVTES